MEWYLPITILPGLGMLILSTTTQLMSLSGEIGQLLSNKCSEMEHKIAGLKIQQIKRLSYATTFLYIAAGLYVLSGIVAAFINVFSFWSNLFLIIGTFLVFASIVLLIIYAFKTISIRQLQFKNNPML